MVLRRSGLILAVQIYFLKLQATGGGSGYLDQRECGSSSQWGITSSGFLRDTGDGLILSEYYFASASIRGDSCRRYQ